MALGQPENQVYGFLQGRCNETCRKAGRTSRLEMADESHIMRASSPSRRLQTQQHEFVLHGGRQLLAPDLKLNQPSQQRQRSITLSDFPTSTSGGALWPRPSHSKALWAIILPDFKVRSQRSTACSFPTVSHITGKFISHIKQESQVEMPPTQLFHCRAHPENERSISLGHALLRINKFK